MSLSRRCVLALCFLLLIASVLWAQSAKTSIIIERQLVRFITPGEAVEWRLVVTNQQGEVIYDSGSVYGSALEWPLKNQQGEAIESGLYTYTLTSKVATEETARTQRGHLMLARPSESERVWITNDQSASIGADNSARKLAVISGETTVGGAELPGAVPRREVSAERPQSPQRASAEANAEKTAAPTAPGGTANRVAKFAADGTSLIDSAITEAGGNVGIGTTNPQSGLDYRNSVAPFFTRDIGTTNFGTPQSALQLGVTNLGSRNINVGPSFLFFGDNSAGAKSFLGRVSGVWENPTAGAEAGAILFQVRAGSGDTGASTERMRVTAAGNVGIGTPSPFARLQVASAGDGATSYTARFQSSSSVYGAGGILFDQNSTYGWKVHTENTGFTTGTLNFSYVNVANGAAQAANTLVLNGNGNVGIGTNNPTVAKLQVYDSNRGTAVYGTSAVSGGGISIGGIGVYGDTQAADGVGVWGKNSFGGFAMYAEGNTSQQRNKGGWVKALLKVSADGSIERCYNGITGSAGGTCGFSIAHTFDTYFDINFGFRVDDRFASVTADDAGQFAATGEVIYGFGNQNTIRVITHSGGSLSSLSFTIIVY